MRIAFYAPMKPPDHPVPSGDRTVARLLMKALRRAGCDVQLASDLRMFLAAPEALDRSAALAAAEASRLAAAWCRPEAEWRPDVWFTYHLYYKAPDLIGPEVARTCGVPYAVAEASYAGKRDATAWRRAQAHVGAALEQAAVVFAMNAVDTPGIRPVTGPRTEIVPLPPFLDLDDWPALRRTAQSPGPVRLVTVAMMRGGAKVESYRLLAAALHEVRDQDWTLDVVGDGDARSDVEKAFATLGDRVAFHGARDRGDVARMIANADAFVWPGIGEAFGMVYLEAQALGVPVVAIDTAGVSNVVVHDRTGLLAASVSPEAYAGAIRRMIEDGGTRARLGAGAAAFVSEERGLAQAAQTLTSALTRARARSASHDGT